jgi:predicted MFS family arabinose efflux permease
MPRGDSKPDWPIWAMAVAQTIVWAGTFYLFPALLAHLEADFQWSKTTLTLGFSAALLVSAIGSPIAGAVVDAGHGRVLLTGSTAGAALALLVFAMVGSWMAFMATWLALGVCMAGCLYDPCFAYLVRTRGDDARRAITRVTLVAGFAGTLSFPVCNALASHFGWQSAVIAFAILIGAVAAPLMWWGAGAAVTESAQTPIRAKETGHLRTALGRPAFWLLACAFSMLYLNHVTLVTHLLPLLAERGVSLTDAVLTTSLLGPSQVAGRLLMMSLERRTSVNALGVIALAFVVVAAMLIQFADAVTAGLVLFAVLQGAGMGMNSIARPVITANLLGRSGFGAIAGTIAATVVFATAVAPLSAAWVWAAGGYELVLKLNMIIATVALIALWIALKSRRSEAAPF